MKHTHKDFLRVEHHANHAIDAIKMLSSDQDILKSLDHVKLILARVRTASSVVCDEGADIQRKIDAFDKLSNALFGVVYPRIPTLVDVVKEEPSNQDQWVEFDDTAIELQAPLIKTETWEQDTQIAQTSLPDDSEPYSREYMDAMFYGDRHGWANAWLTGKTHWKPDHIPMPTWQADGADMSPNATARIDVLRASGQAYVTPVSTNVHAYCVGHVSEYTGIGLAENNYESQY